MSGLRTATTAAATRNATPPIERRRVPGTAWKPCWTDAGIRVIGLPELELVHHRNEVRMNSPTPGWERPAEECRALA